MEILIFLPFLVCVGGAVWMPIVGWVIGHTIVKKTKALQKVIPVLGGIIGAIIGSVIWWVYVLPQITPPMQ